MLTINIGGKDRNLKFNQLALEEVIKSDITHIEGIAASYTIIHAGLIAACFVARETPDFTFENVCDWIDEKVGKKDVDFILAASNAFMESTAFRNLIPDEELRPEDKKKVTKKIVKK